MTAHDASPDTRSSHVGQSIVGVLRPLRRRQRLLNALRLSAIGLFLGLVAAVLVAAWAWVAPGVWNPWGDSAEAARLVVACLALASAGFVIGAVSGLLVRVDDLRLARAVDRAACSEDRFASALQLEHHHRRDRARLIAADAVARVGATPAAAALPLGVPRAARWSAMPLAALFLLLLLLPERSRVEAAPTVPEISSEEWQSLREEFASEMENLPKAETPEEEQMRRMLEELAQLLEQNPEKKDVLREIARLSEKVEKDRQALSTRDLNMRSAANAIARSEALKQFASTLRQGDYDKAAEELDRLAEGMESGEIAPDANEFESMSTDLERLAKQLSSHREMQQAAQECSKCAGSMNKDQMSQALKRLSQQLRSNCRSMCQGDACRRCNNLLDLLRKRIGQCGGGQCKGQGQCSSLVPSDKKGGLKAGWGSAANWEGGGLSRSGEQRQPDFVEDSERDGEHASFKIVSPDERAESGKSYEELYAEFVQKAEADLDLDSVPVAYREFLRRYFNSIRPQEAATAPDEPADGAARP